MDRKKNRFTFKAAESSRNVGEDEEEHHHPSSNPYTTPTYCSEDEELEDAESEEEAGNEEEEDEEEKEGDDTGEGSSVTIKIKKAKTGRFKAYSEETSSNATHRKKKRKRDDWLLRSDSPWGPQDRSVIPSFGGHILYAIHTDPSKDRLIITGYHRPTQMNKLRKLRLSQEAKELVNSSGLAHLSTSMHANLDMNLLSAFIERWQPDTNTFHLPFGEMTILLHDVHMILGLSIDGDMCGVPESYPDPTWYFCSFIGKTPNQIALPFKSNGPAIYKSGGVLTEAIKDVIDRGSPIEEVQGYLALLLGQTLFVDKTGDRIRPHVFPLLGDVSKIKSYAWGAGTLAYLYRQLGIASRAGSKGVVGCLTLLQAWIYEYFPIFRHFTPASLGADQPRATLWNQKRRFSFDPAALTSYRQQLDSLRPISITWMPYGRHSIHTTSLFSGCLRFMDVREPYQADRCLRQFGYIQVIPSPMPRPVCHRPASGVRYAVEYGEEADHNWITRVDHRIALRKSRKCIVPTDEDEEYTDWYTTVSQPLFYSGTHVSDSVDVHATASELSRRFVELYAFDTDEQALEYLYDHREEIIRLASPLGDSGSGRGRGRHRHRGRGRRGPDNED